MAVPTSLASTISATPARPWPWATSHSAASLTGNSSAVGSKKTASAAHGGRRCTPASIWRITGRWATRASRRCSGSQPHSSNTSNSASPAMAAWRNGRSRVAMSAFTGGACGRGYSTAIFRNKSRSGAKLAYSGSSAPPRARASEPMVPTITGGRVTPSQL